jgi:hypothetical protein
MNRQTFLGTLVILPIGTFLVHCSSTSSGSSNASAAPPTKSGTLTTYTSSNVQSHVHTFMLDDMSVAAPPSAGVSGATSAEQSHSHLVSISSDQLQQIATGQSITVTTSSVSGHTHVFTFVKVS